MGTLGPLTFSSERLPFRGTLLNTLTVVLGSLLGLALGRALPDGLQGLALTGLGLVTVGLGVKMFLSGRNVLVVAASVAIGGVLGKLIGIDVGVASLAELARQLLGSEGGFNEGFVTASVLYCVGPMTLLGCIQDGLERKIDLLSLKSLLDGIASVFLAATSPAFGAGVLASAAVVLVVQSLFTALARPLQRVAERRELIDEATAAGGAMMLAVGLGLLQIKKIPTEVFLPGLVLAPVLASRFERTIVAGEQTI